MEYFLPRMFNVSGNIIVPYNIQNNMNITYILLICVFVNKNMNAWKDLKDNIKMNGTNE